MNETQTPLKNWAGNYTYQARKLHQPTTLEQVQEIIANADHVHVLGSRHSFNNIADSMELISLENLASDVAIDREAKTVSFSGPMKYGDLAKMLNAEGLAVHNLASLPHISVVGAVSTATHGSGVSNRNLASAVVGLEIVTASGELIKVAKSDKNFAAMVVGLGALGAVTRITLDVQPAFIMKQRVFESLSWGALYDHFDEITTSGYSVSIFTRWGEKNDQVWVKSRVDQPDSIGDELFGAVAATVDRHPILGIDASACTSQLGIPGLWSDRLPHFRMDHTPSAGEEIQSEYHLPHIYATEAIEAVHALADKIRPVLLVSEIRRVAADRLWMSMNYEQDTVAIHFTWKREPAAVNEAIALVEAALAPFAARPHWGKLFHMKTETIARLYPRYTDFVHLMEQLDPHGTFQNTWLKTHVLGERA